MHLAHCLEHIVHPSEPLQCSADGNIHCARALSQCDLAKHADCKGGPGVKQGAGQQLHLPCPGHSHTHQGGASRPVQVAHDAHRTAPKLCYALAAAGGMLYDTERRSCSLSLHPVAPLHIQAVVQHVYTFWLLMLSVLPYVAGDARHQSGGGGSH